jgi:hypothetical protein
VKGLWLIVTGVVVAHAVAFYFIGGWNPLPKVRYIAPPNFSLGWAKYTDPGTKEKMVYREFTVSTEVQKTPAAAGATPQP